MGFTEILPGEECLGLVRHRCVSKSSPHRGKEVACLHICPEWGLRSQSFREQSQSLKRQGVLVAAPGPGGPLGSELVPDPAGAVRVVHGERVGLRVEYPVFQGEHVVFREQKIEIPVPRAEREARDRLSVLWGTGDPREQISGASVAALRLRVQGGPRPHICLEGWSQGRCPRMRR